MSGEVSDREFFGWLCAVLLLGVMLVASCIGVVYGASCAYHSGKAAGHER